MVAIVGVRTFGLARPVLRYAERLRSHDTVLRVLAERRVAVYDALVPLVPGRLGRRRGDLLSSLVDDVDAELDAALRVRLPVRSAALVLAVAPLAAWIDRPGPLSRPSAWLWPLVRVAVVGLLIGFAMARAVATVPVSWFVRFWVRFFGVAMA
jgi:ATP-binding cassette subfamily C protein CydCD